MATKAEQFARDGYIVLENFFNEEQLNFALRDTLRRAGPHWFLSTTPMQKGDEWLWEVDYVPLQERNYAYAQTAIDTAHRACQTEGAMCYAFVRTRNEQVEEPLRKLMEGKFKEITEITGVPVNTVFSAFLSSYEQGCFLSPHTDHFDEDPAPVLAMVLSLTKEWKWHWGGILHLMDKPPHDGGGIEKTILPAYNSLALFKLPRWHFVNEVAKSAPHKRLSFTGWLQFIPETS